MKNNCVLLHLVVGQMETNCYIFGSKSTKEVCVIDPGADEKRIRDVIKKEGFKALFIINTHGHVDHISANNLLGLAVYIHEYDADFLKDPMLSMAAFYGNFKSLPAPSRLLKDRDEIEVTDSIRLEVIHTPGHTPGSISLYWNGLLFSGDTLFENSVGRTDLPHSNSTQIVDSIKNKLLKFPDETIVLPGHGAQTTIGAERKNNPWL